VVSKMWTRLASGVAFVSVLCGPMGPLLLSNSLMAFCLSRLSRRPALFPPRGEEKEKREVVQRKGHFHDAG
jgi:hypothetical protein